MEEKNTNKLDTIDILLLAFLIVIALINVILLLTDSVSAASDYHNVVTNAIYTGTTHCSTNQTGICTSDTSSTSYSRYTFGTTSYQNTLSMNFWLNTTVRKNVNATIRLTGTNWANVPYTCQTNYFTDCRVVRANSTILNINFSNPDNAVSGVEFFITANGSILNTNDTFYVQKADLYETNFVDEESQNTQDLINNQNQNTEDIINNNNQNTQDVINNQNQNTLSIIDKLMDSTFNNCADGYRNFLIGSDKSYISNNTGRINSNNNYFVTSPIRIKENTSYTLDIVNATGIQYGYYCFYNKNMARVGNCTKYTDNTTTSYTFTSPANAYFVTFTLYRNNNVITNSNLKGYTCVTSDYENKVTSLQELFATTETNDLMKDDSVDQGQANSFFNDFATNDNGGISSIVSKPLVLINSLLSNNNSCASLNITIPGFRAGMQDTQVSLPSGCSLWNQAPNSLVVAWNTLVVGSACYVILKKLFKLIEQLKEPDNDSVEVIDL